jgi:hypothetical protein
MRTMRTRISHLSKCLAQQAFLILVAFAVGSPAVAAGFDTSYNVFQGDLNNDGNTDLHVKSSSVTVIPLDDLPIVIGPPVREFVLRNRGDRTFDLVSVLTSSERIQVAQWSAANVGIAVRDIDADGYEDLDLRSVNRAASGVRDQIVLSSRQYGAAPRQLISKSDKIRNFTNDLSGAIFDNDYFTRNVPYRVTGVEPPTRRYYGSIVNEGNFSGTSMLLTGCRAGSPNSICELSTVDPSPCVRTVNIYNERDEYVGTGPRDVCPSYVHVFVYVPGSVTLTADYSVFDQDARETKDILNRLQQGCGLFQQNTDVNQIETIFSRVYGFPVSVLDRYVSNSDKHPAAPGDEIYNRSDPTFHHYDVRNKICDIGQANCNLIATSEYETNGLRGFTLPSYQMRQLWTPVDGSPIPVYVPFTQPWNADKPSAYTREFGTVTQRWAQLEYPAGYWSKGIQNVTTPQHWVYPGTIIRKVFQEGNAIYVRTHGMGVNRLWCINEPTGATAAAGLLVAMANDSKGTTTFNTLDKVFIDKFRGANGYPAHNPSASGGEGMVFKDGSSID